MIAPRRAIDDLGQEAEASITFLRYSLELAYRKTDDNLVRGNLAIVKEELVHITHGDAPPTSFISFTVQRTGANPQCMASATPPISFQPQARAKTES